MSLMKTFIIPGVALTLAMVLPATSFAAGSGNSNPPTATETTTKCKKGEVWDKKTEKCVKVEGSNLTNDQRFEAVRELAYAGRPDEALAVLATMTEGDSDRVLTYKGFANRKAGRIDVGMQYYAEALKVNPDNLLARSYMGQGYVEIGETKLAMLQLDEIVQRGGQGTWAEQSLRQAIGTGQTMNY
jgi:tetratricopeptide (TPR) repeat protein